MLGTFNRVVVTIVVACLGIAPTFVTLWPKWTDSHTYSHGLLIIPLCAWLLWREKDRINAVSAQPAYWAVVPLFGLLFVWTFSYAAAIQIGVEAVFPAILLGAVLVSCGWNVASLAAVPVLLLYSAIPVWDLINSTLQAMTVRAVDLILTTIRVPAFIQGNFVEIPSGLFEIAGGCSGIHFFIVAVTMAVVYGHLYYVRTSHKIALITIAAAMALVMNWVRVSIIITAGHLTEMQSYLVQVDHYYFGWALFAVMLWPFFLIARRLEPESELKPGDTPMRAAVDGSSQSSLAIVAVVALLPILVWGRLVQQEPRPFELQLPAVFGLHGPTQPSGQWQPIFRNPDGEAIGRYVTEGGDIEVYANWYFTQSQGRELIGYGNSVIGESLDAVRSRNHVETDSGNHAKSLEIREIIAESESASRYLVWYLYLIGAETEVSPLRAKLRQGMQSLRGSDAAGIIAMAAECREPSQSCDMARKLIEKESAKIYNAVHQSLLTLDEL